MTDADWFSDPAVRWLGGGWALWCLWAQEHGDELDQSVERVNQCLDDLAADGASPVIEAAVVAGIITFGYEPNRDALLGLLDRRHPRPPS